MRGFEGRGRHLRSGPATAAKSTFALTHPSNLRETIGFTAQVLSDSSLRAAGAEGEIDGRDYQLAFVMARHT